MSSRTTVMSFFPLYAFTAFLHSTGMSGAESELRDVLRQSRSTQSFVCRCKFAWACRESTRRLRAEKVQSFGRRIAVYRRRDAGAFCGSCCEA